MLDCFLSPAPSVTIEPRLLSFLGVLSLFAITRVGFLTAFSTAVPES